MFKKIEQKVITLLVLFLSLILMVVIGYADAIKSYTGQYMASANSISQTVQYKVNSFLQSGHPINQFSGFETTTNPLLKSEIQIESMRIYDDKRGLVFKNDKSSYFEKEIYKKVNADFVKGLNLSESKNFYLLSLELRDKFEEVGELQVAIPKSGVMKVIDEEFTKLIQIVAAIIFAYLLFLFLSSTLWKDNWKTWVSISYGLVYLAASSVVLYTLFTIFMLGIDGKARALSDTLAQRLNSTISLGVPLSSVKNVEDVFQNYLDANPDIKNIELKDQKKSIVKSGDFKEVEETLNYDVMLKSSLTLKLYVGVGEDVIREKTRDNIKNFLALFIASGFISLIFLNLAISYGRKKEISDAKSETSDVEKKDLIKDEEEVFYLELIKPLFFVSIFVEGLLISFLPQYFTEIAVSSGLSDGVVSYIFTAYYLGFALILIPAATLLKKVGIKNTLNIGLVLFSLGMLVMLLLGEQFTFLILSRVLAGLGQGILLIGVQSYILNVASQKRKTQGAAIIVYGYNGGMLSGMVIGALAVNYIDPAGVFTTYIVLGLVMTFYVLMLPNNVSKLKEQGESKGGLKDLFTIFKDASLVKGMFLIGIPTKMVLGGVIYFAMPLILSQMGFAQESIGQIIIFYSIGVLIASFYSARLTDRINNAKLILTIGSFTGAIGLMLMGATELVEVGEVYKLVLLLGGMALLGISHGFIHAPVISYVASTDVSKTIGATSATSSYRFIERIGHALGPIVVAAFLAYFAGSILSLFAIGSVILLFTLIFQFSAKKV